MKRILIRGPDTIGSFVLATPFFRELRRNYTDSYIVLCIKPLVYEIAKNCPYVNKVLIYERNKILNIKILRKERFDVVFLLSGSFESAFVCFLSGIKERIGYSHDHRGIFLTKKIVEKEKMHYIDYILNILESIGCNVYERSPEIYLLKENKNYEFLFRDEKPVVGINYFSIADDARSWPEDYVVYLSRELVKKGFRVVLLGKDNKENSRIKIEDNEVINLINKTTLNDFISIVKNLSYYISVSTGGIHIASVLGVKVIGLYCPGEEVGWTPYGKNSKVIIKNVECSPCNQHKMKYCRDNICMKKILPEEVLSYINF